MDLGLTGKLAVVTGASRGLGFGAAETLGEEGARVAIVARSAEAIEDAERRLRAKGIDAHSYVADLTVRGEVEGLFERIGEQLGVPDILVYNNAGARDVYFEQATDEDFRHAYDILVMGFTWCMRAVLPGMQANGWGRVVTLGSLAGKEPHKDFPMALHNLGRPAQMGLSKTLANEYGRYGITLNTIGTGMLDHDGLAVARAYDRGISSDEIREKRTAAIPMARTGTAGELGALTAYLCSEQAGFITGQFILLDGGKIGALY